MRQAGARKLREDELQREVAPRRLELVEPIEDDVRPLAPGERRTVTITGRPYEAPRRRRSSQVAAQPDRMAMWAVLLGLFMVFMAVITGGPA